MVKYICSRCKKRFDHKGTFDRHVNRKKKCEIVLQKQRISAPDLECGFCGQNYSRRYHLNRHLDGRCPQLKTLDSSGQKSGQKSRKRSLSPEDKVGLYKYFDEESDENSDSPKSESFSQDLEKNSPKSEKEGKECEYCGKMISFKRNYKRHLKRCKKKKEEDIRTKLKAQEEKIKKLEEKLKAKEEVEEEYFDLLKKVAKKGGNSVTYNQKNMYFIMNNYKSAHNYETLMEPELSDTEIKKIKGSSVQAGVFNFLEGRCIEGVDMNKRPFHCVDDSRNKYLLYTGDKWKIDKNASDIIDTARDKVKAVYDTDIKRGQRMSEIHRKLDTLDELFTFEKKGRKKILRELNKKTMIQNDQ